MLNVYITLGRHFQQLLLAHTSPLDPAEPDTLHLCCMVPEKLKVSAQFFSEAELQGMEAAAKATHAKADSRLPPAAFHKTHSQCGGLKRTKMFFGARCEHLTCLCCPFLYSPGMCEHAPVLS